MTDILLYLNSRVEYFFQNYISKALDIFFCKQQTLQSRQFFLWKANSSPFDGKHQQWTPSQNILCYLRTWTQCINHFNKSLNFCQFLLWKKINKTEYYNSFDFSVCVCIWVEKGDHMTVVNTGQFPRAWILNTWPWDAAKVVKCEKVISIFFSTTVT